MTRQIGQSIGQNAGAQFKAQYNACDDPPSIWLRALGEGALSFMESFFGFDPTGKEAYHKARGQSLNHSMLFKARAIAEHDAKMRKRFEFSDPGKPKKSKPIVPGFFGQAHCAIAVAVAVWDLYCYGMFIWGSAKSAWHKSTSMANRLSPCNRQKRGHVIGSPWPNVVMPNQWCIFNAIITGGLFGNFGDPSTIHVEDYEQAVMAFEVKVRPVLQAEYVNFDFRIVKDYGHGRPLEIVDHDTSEVINDVETEQAYGSAVCFCSEAATPGNAFALRAEVYVSDETGLSNTNPYLVEVKNGYMDKWTLAKKTNHDGGEADIPQERQNKARRTMNWLLRNWNNLPKRAREGMNSVRDINGWPGVSTFVNENHITLTTSGSTSGLVVMKQISDGPTPAGLTVEKTDGGIEATLTAPSIPTGWSIVEADFTAIEEMDLTLENNDAPLTNAIAKQAPYTAIIECKKGVWNVIAFFVYKTATGSLAWSLQATKQISTT